MTQQFQPPPNTARGNQQSEAIPTTSTTNSAKHSSDKRKATMSSKGDSDSNSHRRSRLPDNRLQPLEEDQQQHQQQEDGPSAARPNAAQQPLSPPPLASGLTTASSGSSGGSGGGRRRMSAARLRASSTGGGSRSPAPAAAAACLPLDTNLYDSLVRYQEDNDDNTIVSMGAETLRSVSTWYSVQSDDDRKIPARPVEGSYEGTYREPLRRNIYKPSKGSTSPSNNNNAAASPAAAEAPRAAAAAATPPDFDRNASSSSSSDTGTTAGQANSNHRTTSPPQRSSSAGRYPPPAAAARRTSSGSMSRSVASGPPPVVWEEEAKDDHTCVSSLANHTADRSEESSELNVLPRHPLGGIDEGCAMGNSNANSSSNKNSSTRRHDNGSPNSEFACLSAAAQLAQEANIGDMIETTRSAPTPYGGPGGARHTSFPGGAEWGSMDWTIPNLVVSPNDNNNNNNAGGDTTGQKAPPSSSAASSNTASNARDRSMPTTAAPSTTTTNTAPPPPMNDFTRMQQTLGMQDLCVPGSSNSNTNSSGGIQSQQSGGRRLSPSQSQPMPIPTAPNSSISSISSQGTPSAGGSASLTTSSSSNNTSRNDPTTQEQYQIWKQIQEDQERKQIERALQLSQQQTAAASSAGVTTRVNVVEPVNSSATNDSSYPAQNAKPAPQQAGTEGEELDEEEALKVALRISQEEAAANEAAWKQHGSSGSGSGSGGNSGEEEDEIALALRLSKEQAEADQKLFQQLQETAGELSEEEQMRLAMEQSMNPRSTVAAPAPREDSSSEAHEGVDEEMRRALAESMQRAEPAPDAGSVDEDMRLALRLSQVQMEEEERFRQSFLEPPKDRQSDDPVTGDESFSKLIQPFPGEHVMDDTEDVPPVRSRPSEEPASPGPHDWGRRTMGGRRGGGIPNDMSGSGPSYEPSIQDLEDLSQEVHKTFPQQPKHPSDEMSPHYVGAQHAKVHGPDDGMDTPPVSRPQRKDSKEGCNTEAQISNVVDIDRDSRDVLVREGQSETRAAIMQGQSQIVTCRGCFGKLHAPMNCSLVFCPTCNTVSQVTGMGV